MSNRKIQGIKIEFQGDATPLKQALEDVDKASGKTSSELGKINRALRFDEGNTTLLAQKQEVLQDAIKNTTTRLDYLKAAQSDVERMFASGDIDASSYREFKREIEIAEGKIRDFRNEAENVKAKLEVRVDTSEIDKLENELKSLPETAKQVGKEIGKGLMVGAAGLGALTVGMESTNKQLSRLDSIASSTVSSVNKLGNNIKKMSDAEIEALEKSLDDKEDALSKSYDKQISLAEKTYDAQEKALDKSLNNEMSALEKAHDRKLQLLDNEYKERLKLIDEDEYRRLKAIDSQIEGIEAQQDAIDKANKLEEDNAKRLELQQKVNSARTKYDKSKASKELADFEAKLIDERKADERKATIENLKEQKDAIRETADRKKEAVQNEYDLKVEQINESFEREKESLSQLHDLKREQFAAQKEQYLANIREQYNEELTLFKEMNAKKIQEAQKPVSNKQVQQSNVKVNLDVSDFRKSRVMFDAVDQDVDQGVEALGNLVRAGYETEEDLTKISKNLAGAVQQYGATFNVESLAESITTTTQLGEVTGQLMDLLEKNGMTVEEFNAEIQQYSTVGERANYISELLASQGMAQVYDEFAKTHPEIVKNSEAQVEYIDAVNGLTTALTPLITELTKVITWISEFGAKHPIIAQGIAVLGTAIGGIVAVFGVLYPVVKNIMAIFPKLAKFLPHLAKGFMVLSGPIGWVISIVLTLISLVPVIIKHWGKISGFFSDLWEGVLDGFKWAIKGIEKLAKGIVKIVKAPINAMIKLLNGFLTGVNKIKIPDWVPGGIGGKGFKIPEIPMLAKGTDFFRGGMAIVGEKGPELVQMPMGTKVHTANETAGMLGGGEITINVPLSIDGRAFAHAVAKYTNREFYEMQQRDKRGR